ncbi:MAG: translocation/assembly module TamB domain-containing protein [Bacteroidetes bacterium]|nr:translocation/assembly module TamB domain-containing protein [Bacteroidota bacterium]
MRKALKITGYVLGSILLLLILVVVLLNTPYGKNFVKNRAVAFLRGKLKTEVYVGELGYGLPKMVVLKDVVFKDQAKDTLLAARELRVDIDMLKLFKKQVDIRQIHLAGIHAHVYRDAPDTNFNYSYIITAFTGNTPKTEKKEAVKDTSSAPMVIDLNRLVLDDIHIRFDDYTGGTRLALDLDKLDLRMRKMDLDSMDFRLKELAVAGLKTTFLQDSSLLPPKPDTSTKPTQFRLVADDIRLDNVSVHYGNSQNKMLFDLRLGELQARARRFDLAKQEIEIDKFMLDSTDSRIVIGKNSYIPAKVDTITDTLPQSNWHLVAKDLALNEINFAFDNENLPKQSSGIDYGHLAATKLRLEAQDVLFTDDTLNGNIKHLAVSEKSGFDLYELHTQFAYNPKGASLKGLYVQTPYTLLQDYVQVAYPSLDALKTNMASMMLAVNLKNSIIGIHDILLFAPQLEKQEVLRKNRNGRLRLDAALYGYVNAIDIRTFTVAGLGSTEIDLSGKLNGLPDANKLSYNLSIAKFRSSRNDIAGFLPPATQKQLQLPERFGISGTLAGTAKDYYPKLVFMSTDGNAVLNGYVKMSTGKGRERYDMHVKTAQLNMGHILRDTTLGPVTADITAKGQGFDVKTMTAAVDGAVQGAYYKGYTYSNIKLNAKVAARVADVKLNSNDPNAKLSLDAHADMREKYTAVKGILQMDSVDFHALKLYKTALRTHGTIDIDFPKLDPDYPEGVLVWKDAVIATDSLRYATDSLYVSSKPSPDTGQNIVVNFDALQAHITGKTPLTKVGDIVQENINRHYMGTDTTKGLAAMKHSVNKDSMPAQYDLKMVASLSDRPILHGILPDLKSLDTVHIDGELTQKILVLNILMPQVVYGSNSIEKAEAHVNGSDSAFTYAVTADKISTGSMQFLYSKASGNVAPHGLTTNITVSDSAKKERFALAASMQQQGDTQVIQLQPGLKLNYTDWAVAQTNRIALAKGGMYVQNFSISNGGQYLKMNSDRPALNAPLKVDISNFLLANITEIISKDTVLLANGVLGGNVTLEQFQPSPQITSALRIDNLSVLGDTVGNLKIDVNNKTANAIDAKVTVDGHGNDVAIAGFYYTKPVNGNSFDMKLDMKALNLRSIEGLTGNAIKSSSGFLRGQLTVRGMADAPVVIGEIHTDNVATTVSMLNAFYRLPDEKIVFTEQGPNFANFKILDSAGNQAVLNGKIVTRNYRDMEMALNVNANNWRAVHSTAQNNKLFYGDLYLSTNLNINGTPVKPQIDGNLNVLKNTKFVVAVPKTDPGLESAQGIVRFVDMDDTNHKPVLQPLPKDSIKKLGLSPGSNVNVNLNVDKDAELSVIIDQASGDFIKVRGVASLNTSVDPAGNLAVTGTYELNEGAYQFNYNFVKRRFDIQKGSIITMAGDPMRAQMDITAVYNANIPAYDLVQNQVPDPSQLNYYKERLPFQVLLKLKGRIMKPDISFDIVLPEGKSYRLAFDQVELVRAKLAQVRMDTSELNKQVFAVLILNRFVSENILSSGAGSSVSSIARQSVSRFIGEQLNQFANGLIKGIDLSVDLATSDDYTTGEQRNRTDLNLAASKRLFNDRLKVTVGNNFELEGPQTQRNSQGSSYIPGNLAADYNLTQDGRYVTRIYRQDQDEGVLEGYVTETGVNFIVSLDYNRFKYIFKRRRPKGNALPKVTDTTNKK